jgi:hypothetical protein
MQSAALGAASTNAAAAADTKQVAEVASQVSAQTKEAEKKSVELFHNLLRREQTETLHRELDSTVLAEFAKAEVLNRVLQSVADALNAGHTQDFLRTLSLCTACQNYEKIAKGNAMCTDRLQGGLVAALSYGIDGNDSWGMAVASKYQIPLHEYDCVNRKPPEVCEGCTVTFHNECIVSSQGYAPGPHYKSLGQQLLDLNMVGVPDRSMLLKIDVDSGMEWDILREEPAAFLRKFRQIVVAYHQTNLVQNHHQYLLAGKNLEAAGFVVTHLHGDAMKSGVHASGEYTLPTDIEVTYVQKPKDGCTMAAGPQKDVTGASEQDVQSQKMKPAVIQKHATMRKQKPAAQLYEEANELDY